MPARLPSVAAGGAVVALALPIFFVAGWRVGAWALAAVLWLASQALGYLLLRLRFRMGNLAASGVLAFGMMFRAVAVMVVVIVVAASDVRLALGAALLYALAYTFELGVSVLSYFSGPAE